LEKIVSDYHVVYGGQLDEDGILSKCRNAISSLEKVDKEIGSDIYSGIPLYVSS
jgi:regulator of Ty1 transposition protein 103